MHISDGILAAPVLVTGAVAAAGGVAIGLRGLSDQRVPRVAVVAAGLFVASLIHVPLGPSSAHLVFSGLAGVLLGWAVFPALLVGLGLQFVLFTHGGLTSLGVNVLNMALPAVVCGWAFRGLLARPAGMGLFAAGFATGALSLLATALMAAASLALSGRAFWPAAQVVFWGHLPVMVVEGLVTASVVVFLRRLRPELLTTDAVLPAADVRPAA